MKDHMKKLRSDLRRHQIKRIFAVLLCLCMLVPMLQLTAVEVSAADYGSSAYQATVDPGDGGTFVFFSNISNNLERSDPADRLLTADTSVPSNPKGTTTTEFSKDENYSTNYILWGNDTDLADYRFIITKIDDTYYGNDQGYTIKQEKTGEYLDVTQSFQITKQRGSTAQYTIDGQLTYYDGEIFPTLAYVCLSDNPRTWYWDNTYKYFYTVYTSNIANSGSKITVPGTNTSVYAQVTGDGVYLINWGNYRAYASDSELSGYTGLDNYSHFPANSLLRLVGVNGGNAKSPDYSNNMAEVLHNPLYYLHDMYPSVGNGCASLGVFNAEGGNNISPYADFKIPGLYREIPLYSLTVNNGSGSGIYPEGTTVDISAAYSTADGHFSKWEIVSGEGNISVNFWSSTSITLNSDVEIEAVYSPHTMQPDDGNCLTEEKCTFCGYVAIPKQETHNLGKYTNPSDGKHTAHCINTGCTYTVTQDCTSNDTATCKTRKVCNVCGAPFGELDPDNHEGTPSWQQTKTTHTKVYDCCGAVVVPEEEHTWENGKCTVCGYSCSHEGGEGSYFKKPVCDICGEEYGELLIDSTVPTGEIKVSNNIWNTLLNKITFGKFFNETQQVEITASDDSYEHTGYTDEYKVNIGYYLYNGDNALTKDELDETTFTPYEGSFNITPDNQYVIYAKITDHAGNITYISSDGIVLDTVRPIIKGITGGKTYCEEQVFTVEETNLQSVLINEAVATADDAGNYVLTAENKEYTITATDKAGNSTQCTVTVNNGHDWNDATYTWSDDGSYCIATRTCKNDAAHEEKATAIITKEKTKDPTCTANGETTYTATFAESWAAKQSKAVKDIPATGHSWGEPVYTWSEDGKACTATRTCKNDSSHTETAKGSITNEQTKAPTCTGKGETTYTATFDVDWAKEQEKVIADIPSTGHKYENGKCTVCSTADPNYKPTEPGDKDTDLPQTGDNSNLALWIALLFASGAGLFGASAYRRKKKYNQ